MQKYKAITTAAKFHDVYQVEPDVRHICTVYVEGSPMTGPQIVKALSLLEEINNLPEEIDGDRIIDIINRYKSRNKQPV